MNATEFGVAASLALLTATLAVLSTRGVVRFLRERVRCQLMWGAGLALGAVATSVEFVVYLGVVDVLLLQVYVFLSAVIVGVLSLGSTRAIRSPRFRSGYTVYTLACCALIGVFSFTTPLSSAMVSQGVIDGNPPPLLIGLSILVTVPATFVLLGAVVLSLWQKWRWQTFLMGIGAGVLAGGGALYVASFPVALYYAEFLGIVLIVLGLVNLPQASVLPAIARYRPQHSA